MGDLIGKIVFGLIATIFTVRSFQVWKQRRGVPEQLVTGWLWALVLAAVFSQVLFAIPATRFLGIDWSILFRGSWPSSRPWYATFFYVCLGLLLFYLVRFVLSGGLYLLIVKSLRLSKPLFWVHWPVFLASYFALEYPFQWYASATEISYARGLDDFAIGFLQPQNAIPGVVILLLTTLTLNSLRSSRETATYSWSAWIPALFGGYLAYQSTRNGWLAVLFFGFLSTWAGQRLPRIVQLPRKTSRFLFWLLFDLPTLVVAIGSWVLWHKGWLTFVLTSLSLVILGFGLMPLLLMRLLPIVARQEWITLIQSNTAQASTVETLKRDLARLEREDLRKRTLRKLRRQQQQLETAERARQARRYDQALTLLDDIIDSLSKVTSLIADQKQCLGRAYQSRAKIRLEQASLDSAHADIKKAQKYIQPDLELIGGMADLASSRNYDQAITLQYGLDYLGMMRGKPADDRFRRIQVYLEKFCEIGPATSNDQVTRIQQIADQVILIDPNCAWAHRAQGQAWIRLERWDQALNALETSVRIAPQDKAAQYALGQVYQHYGRHSDARRAYEESLQLDKTQVEVTYALGVLLLDVFGKKDLKAATTLLGQAARAAPGNAAYQYDWGRACLQSGDWKHARLAFEEALRLDPASGPKRRALADLLYDRGEWTAALPHFETLHKTDPDDPGCRVSLARCLLETGAAARAVDVIRSQAGDDTRALFVLGRAHLRLGQYVTAVEELQKLSREQKENGEALYYLGCAYAWLGTTKNPSYFKNAIQSLEKAEEADASLAARVSLQMGHVYLRQDRVEEAIRCYRAAGETTEFELSAGLALARAYMADGRLGDADHALSRLDRYENSNVQHVRGLAAELREDFRAAEKAYRQAGSNGALGVILYKQGRTAEAMSALRQARQSGEDSDRILYYSGLCQIEAGAFEQGISEWELLATRHPESAPMRMNITRAWYKWGCELYRQRKYTEAARAWEPLIASNSGDEEQAKALQQLYLLAAYHEENPAEKKRLVQRAGELGAEQSLLDTIVALGYLTEGDAKNALITLSTLVRQDPDNALLNYNLGLVSLSIGKARDAIKHFLCAQNSANSHVSRLGSWGLVAALGSTGQWQEAARVLDSALE